MALVLFGGFFVGTLWFANKNPGAALLEGAHLLRWQQAEMAAKGMPQPPIEPAIEEPNSPPLIGRDADKPDER